MTKAELIAYIAEHMTIEMPKTHIEAVLDQLAPALLESRGDADGLRLPGIGTFRTKRQDERPGTNPHTGGAITIAARNKIVFKPAKALSEAVQS